GRPAGGIGGSAGGNRDRAVDGRRDARRGDPRGVGRAPRLAERQQHARQQERPPKDEERAGRANAQQPRQRGRRGGQQRALYAVDGEIAEPQTGGHFFFLMRAISFRSASDRWSSSRRCTTSGRPDPLNTRLTNSRTIAWIT